jgi:CheY-like chemotaxis protein
MGCNRNLKKEIAVVLYSKRVMKIVHLDNSEFFRKLVRAFLIEKGIEYEGFEHATLALEALKDEEAGILMTSMFFAEMELDEFVKQVRALPRHIPIITLTSGTSNEQLLIIQQLHVDAHLLKTGPWQQQLSAFLDKHVT